MIALCFSGLTVVAVISKHLIMQGVKGQARMKDAVIGFSWKVSLSAVAQKNIAKRAVDQANAESSNLLQVSDPLQNSASVVPEVAESVKSAAEIWGPLLKNVDAIMQIVDKMAEVRRKSRRFSSPCSLSSHADSSIRTCGLVHFIGCSQGRHATERICPSKVLTLLSRRSWNK